MSETLTGKRIPDDTETKWSPGDYWRLKGGWVGITPSGLFAGLGNHEVTEHEDGTITVKPSILVRQSEKSWHGFLERGVWKEC